MLGRALASIWLVGQPVLQDGVVSTPALGEAPHRARLTVILRTIPCGSHRRAMGGFSLYLMVM